MGLDVYGHHRQGTSHKAGASGDKPAQGRDSHSGPGGSYMQVLMICCATYHHEVTISPSLLEPFTEECLTRGNRLDTDDRSLSFALAMMDFVEWDILSLQTNAAAEASKRSKAGGGHGATVKSEVDVRWYGSLTSILLDILYFLSFLSSLQHLTLLSILLTNTSFLYNLYSINRYDYPSFILEMLMHPPTWAAWRKQVERAAGRNSSDSRRGIPTTLSCEALIRTLHSFIHTLPIPHHPHPPKYSFTNIFSTHTCWAVTGSRRSTYFDGLVSDFKRRQQQQVEDVGAGGGVGAGAGSSVGGRSDGAVDGDQEKEEMMSVGVGERANERSAGLDEKTKLGSDNDKGSDEDKGSHQLVEEVRTHCKYPWDDTEGAPTQEAMSRAKVCVRRGRIVIGETIDRSIDPALT